MMGWGLKCFVKACKNVFLAFKNVFFKLDVCSKSCFESVLKITYKPILENSFSNGFVIYIYIYIYYRITSLYQI